MIPVLLAVGTSAVLVRLLGVTLSPLTTVGGPLVVATCAEFSHPARGPLRRGTRAVASTRGQSTRVAAERTGRAFFTSALTTLGGFAVLMFSPLPLLADFGLVVTINIAVAVLAALVVVPPLVDGGRPARAARDGPAAGRHASRGRSGVGWISGAVLLAAGIGLFVATTVGRRGVGRCHCAASTRSACRRCCRPRPRRR